MSWRDDIKKAFEKARRQGPTGGPVPKPTALSKINMARLAQAPEVKGNASFAYTPGEIRAANYGERSEKKFDAKVKTLVEEAMRIPEIMVQPDKASSTVVHKSFWVGEIAPGPTNFDAAIAACLERHDQKEEPKPAKQNLLNKKLF